MDYTSLMPGEIALHIFKFLTLEDATHVGQANWYWANAARAERRCVGRWACSYTLSTAEDGRCSATYHLTRTVSWLEAALNETH